MSKMMRRNRKLFSLALLVLQAVGARVVSVTDACETSRAFFVPDLSCRAVIKTVTRQKWEQPAPRSLGIDGVRYRAQDLEKLRQGTRLATIAFLPSTETVIDARGMRANPRYAWKLPSESLSGAAASVSGVIPAFGRIPPAQSRRSRFRVRIVVFAAGFGKP